MKFEGLLRILDEEPLFETGLLLAGGVDPAAIRQQLSRWKRAGKVQQIRRGLYAVAPPYRKEEPHPFAVANLLCRPSYVSLHSALAFFGLIPEYVPAVTSATTGRPGEWSTPLGRFTCRNVRQDFFWGFRRTEVAPGRHAWVATPEKALLDLVHLEPGGESPEFLGELRLQHLDRLDPATLRAAAARGARPKLDRAVEAILDLRNTEAEEYEEL